MLYTTFVIVLHERARMNTILYLIYISALLIINVYTGFHYYHRESYLSPTMCSVEAYFISLNAIFLCGSLFCTIFKSLRGLDILLIIGVIVCLMFALLADKFRLYMITHKRKPDEFPKLVVNLIRKHQIYGLLYTTYWRAEASNTKINL
jgi:hypothetical protein